MKVLASFYLDCGRSGDVTGLFLTTTEAIEAAEGREVYFGEILGKHSEVTCTFDSSDIEIKSDDQAFITKFEEVMGSGFSTGHNPLDYLSDVSDEDED